MNGLMHLLRRSTFLFLTAIVMAIIGSSSFLSLGLNSAHAAPVSAPVKSQRLLYQTNFRKGMLGWRSDHGGWSAVDSTLNYDGSGDSMISAPYRMRTANFAVQATIEVNRTGDYNPAFGVFVRSGAVLAGYWHDTIVGVEHESAAIWTGANNAYDGRLISETDFAPGTGRHTYRLEVHGTQLTLYVDGALATRGRSNAALTATGVGINASASEVTVRVFKVYALR